MFQKLLCYWKGEVAKERTYRLFIPILFFIILNGIAFYIISRDIHIYKMVLESFEMGGYVAFAILLVLYLVCFYMVYSMISELVTRYKRSKLNNHKGFALVDALVGITVLSVGLTAILFAYTQTTKSTFYSTNYTQAMYIAQTSLEKLKSADLTTDAPVLPGETKTGIYTIRYEIDTTTTLPITLDSTKGTITPVKVVVTWKDGTVEMHSYYLSYKMNLGNI